MPWDIVQRDGEYCVIKRDDGENEGCHATRAEAQRQLAALNASEAGRSLDYAAKLLNLTDDTATVGGWGVVYGGQDLVGENFTPETDFMLELVPNKLALYDHAQQVKHVIGKASVNPLDDGLWVEMELDRHKAYINEILKLIDEKALGMSSGSVAHLIEMDGKTIKRWPIIEVSLTPTPAEPRTLGVERIKLLAEEYPELKALLPQKDAASVEADAEEGSTEAIIENLEVRQMPDEVQVQEVVEETPPAETVSKKEYDAMKARMDDFNTALDKITEAMQKEPALERTGYITNYGGRADEGHKSFGDFLLAIARNDIKRLHEVYKSRKDLLESQGTTGGFLVPVEFTNRLLEIAAEQSRIVSLVTMIPVNVNSGTFPALDYSVTPTAGSGQTALAAGLSAATTEEGVALTEDEPAFEEITWRLHKIGGFTQASNELIMDSPQAIETLLSRLFAITISNKNERNIIRGSGAGEPLGILSAACTIGVATATNNTFAEADAMNMLSRFKPMGGQPVWIMHRGVLPDLANFTASNQDMVDWAGGGVSSRLLGYPLLFSEHMPQDDNDDVILADLSAYLWFQKGTLEIAFSEHFAFTTQLGTWTFTQRNDGQPWLSSAITYADPTGSYTVSPFVFHND